MKRKSTKQSKSASGRGRSAGKSRGMKMGARSSSRSTVRASGRKSASKSTSRAKTSGSKSRSTVSAKSNPRVTSAKSMKSNTRKATARKASPRKATARKSQTRARAGGAISKAVDTLKNAVTSLRSRSALKSTSEMPAKRGEGRARSGGISGARPARTKQPMGTSRNVNASTKPSVGKVSISEIQHAAVDERMAPQSDKPYTGADAFKPNAKGADTLMSAPPRKPIRQSRNQVGIRHH